MVTCAVHQVFVCLFRGVACTTICATVTRRLFLSSPVMKCEPGLSEHFTLATQFHLECSYVSLMYYDYKSAKEHIRKAQELSGLDINMTGMYSYSYSY